MKRDGSLHLDGTTTPLMRLLLRRRSVRKYDSRPATQAQVDYVEGCVRAFCKRMGFTSPRITIVGRGEAFDAVVRGATSGLLGKINPWLPFTKASHLVLCSTVYPSDGSRGGTERAIAEASMAMQVAVLAATEQGLSTCWMAGIDHERVERAHELPDGSTLIAISTLGFGPKRMRVSWDTVAYHLVSKRRRPLAHLRMAERWEQDA